MTFEEILDQALALLQRRGRLTYGTLKRQFQLDDAGLDDLREQLLYAHPQVSDDAGRGLVWTGETDLSPTSIPSPPQPLPSEPPCAPQAIHPPQTATPPATPPLREAERRHLTVMFCDLVESTKLSSQLDPEDYREVLRAYQSTCADVIHRYDGYIAQHLGDALLVYFGYPQAHEDEGQRAVRTGLGMLQAMKTLNERLEHEKGIRLSIRVGIHTGLTVMSDVGAGHKHEMLALGEAPNVASRMQGIAAPDSIAISQFTYRLVEGYFACQDGGEHSLKGVADPVHVYRVLGESGAQSRLDVASTRGLTPLVGREQEVGFLLERWEQVKDGQGQVILLRGEAGIGKSRLVQVLREHVAHESHVRWECRSSPYYQNTALFPLVDLFQRLWRFEAHETPDEKLGKLEHALSQYRLSLEETVPLFAPLLSLHVPEHAYLPLNLSPQRQRQKTLESIGAILLELAEQQPVLFLLEDLHWTDPTTLEFLSLLVEQVPAVAIYTLLTCRPHFQPSWHHRSYLTELTVDRLSRSHIEQMATRVAGGKALPAEIIQQLVDKTDGVPLYVEEMTKTVLESGMLKETNGHYELAGSFTTLAIPSTLQDSLMARLDRLVTAKGIAQLAAVIGRQFAYDLLSTVSQLDEATLQRELRRLVEAEIVYQRGLPPQATYTFKHALIQDAAYESLLKSTRRQYHQHIARVLEAKFPETAETQPEVLACHYTAADLTTQAIPYWQRAGQHASDRSAYVEAISHFTTGIELLKTLPETPASTQQALTLHIALGAALLMTKGHAAPEVEQAYSQAYALCQQVGQTPQLIQVLFGLWRYYNTRPQLPKARELGEMLLRLVQHAHDPALAVVAHYALGTTWFFLGAFPAARLHLEEGIALYTPDRRGHLAFRMGQDPGVGCRLYAALTLWLLGYPARALACIQEALALAHALAHPFSLVYARCYEAIISQVRRDVSAVHEQAEAVVALATAQGFPLWAAMGVSLRGWALAMQGQGEVGMVQVRQGITGWRATGAVLGVPYFCTVLADVSIHLSHTADGLQALAEAHTLMEQHEERCWEAEISRLRGVLFLRQMGRQPEEAETWLRQALDVARHQQAKSLELRAAMSLARLWQQQGKRAAAHDLLAPIYGWFTEGFDTADLQEAKTLLDELAGEHGNPPRHA